MTGLFSFGTQAQNPPATVTFHSPAGVPAAVAGEATSPNLSTEIASSQQRMSAIRGRLKSANPTLWTALENCARLRPSRPLTPEEYQSFRALMKSTLAPEDRDFYAMTLTAYSEARELHGGDYKDPQNPRVRAYMVAVMKTIQNRRDYARQALKLPSMSLADVSQQRLQFAGWNRTNANFCSMASGVEVQGRPVDVVSYQRAYAAWRDFKSTTTYDPRLLNSSTGNILHYDDAISIQTASWASTGHKIENPPPVITLPPPPSPPKNSVTLNITGQGKKMKGLVFVSGVPWRYSSK